MNYHVPQMISSTKDGRQQNYKEGMLKVRTITQGKKINDLSSYTRPFTTY